MRRFIKYFLILLFCVGSLVFVMYKNNTVKAQTNYPFNGMIDADSLVIREDADLKSKEITQLVFGSKVTVTGEKDNYYSITFEDGKTGYALQNHIININDYASTSGEYKAYCDELIGKGFVESYCPQLYYLHLAYPNWQFTPDVLDLTLEEVAKEEEDRNVLQTGNSNYYLRPNPIEVDYYYIKSNVIKSFMDPRNLLYPSLIFQFLDLESSKDIVNNEAMAKISGTNGNLRLYYEEFKKASLENGINPLHAMARSAQEGANGSTYDKEKKEYVASYSAVTGLYTTTNGRTSEQGYSLDGYYNFFNIGSYKSGYYLYPVQRGLAYAAGFLEDDKCFTADSNGVFKYDSTKCKELSYLRPWDSIEKAIVGGVEFIAGSYVKKGQNTLYYQKFNVSSNRKYSLYTHQYMTNIMAPNSEGSKLYGAYKAGDLLNSKFNFIIPVYKDLAGTVAAPIDKNGDASIKEIKFNNEVMAGFDKDVVEYPYSLKINEDSFEVVATPTTPLTKVTGNNKYTFVDGLVTVVINTEAEDGTKKTYTINVKQVKYEEEIKVSDVTDKLEVKLDGDFLFGLSPGMTAQELINSVSSANGTGTIVDSEGKEKATGELKTGDVITITGTKENKKFTIAVTGDLNGDGKVSVLDLLRCQKQILKSINLSGAQNLAADANYDGKISVLDMLKIQKHILGKAKL